MKQDEGTIKHVGVTRKFCDGILKLWTCAKGMGNVADDFLGGFQDHFRVRYSYPRVIAPVFTPYMS